MVQGDAWQRSAVRWAWQVVAVLSGVTCGGESVSNAPGDPAPAGSEAPDAGSIEDSCSCPSPAPHAGSTCECRGLDCEYGWNWCYSGQATCSAEGRWQWPQRPLCPAEPRRYVGCPGEGPCAYEVDVGCGQVTLELSCECVDAQWLLTQVADRPPLCDCAAITAPELCEIYSIDCAWSEAAQRCEAAP